jgi:hypothetical protein
MIEELLQKIKFLLESNNDAEAERILKQFVFDQEKLTINFTNWCKQEYELEDTPFHNKWRDVNGEYKETKELYAIFKNI